MARLGVGLYDVVLSQPLPVSRRVVTVQVVGATPALTRVDVQNSTSSTVRVEVFGGLLATLGLNVDVNLQVVVTRVGQ